MSYLMDFTGKFFCRRGFANGVLVLAVLIALTSRGEFFRLESAGARFGFPGNLSAEDFHQAEAFVDWDLPRRWGLGHEWFVQTRLDASAGWLGDSQNNAAVMTAGPTFVFGRQLLPLSIEGGISPTVITHHEFTTKDLGTAFQFTSHVGLNLDLRTTVRLSYRYQHMSNAGLGDHNPGLNLHMFALSYLF